MLFPVRKNTKYKICIKIWKVVVNQSIVIYGETPKNAIFPIDPKLYLHFFYKVFINSFIFNLFKEQIGRVILNKY
jgi:hypothetical protein